VCGQRPKYPAQAILYAHTEGHIRTVPITALVALSAAEDKTLFRALFPQVIQTPGDLADFLTIVRAKRLRGMDKTITHTMQGWLEAIAGGVVGGLTRSGFSPPQATGLQPQW
jgi:hypothetical protein